MPRFAANLTLLYTELPFLERFAAAAHDGFRAVECLFPYDWPAADIAGRLREHDLTLALFNLPPGDWASGERGLAALPGREEAFAASVERALEYALATGCRRLHAMAGLPPPGDAAPRDVYLSNLRRAAGRLAEHDITLLIEAINPVDMPGYFLSRQQQALDCIAAVDAANLRLQFDCYHCRISDGDPLDWLPRVWERLGHIQIAGVPGRHEPDGGQIDYPALFAQLDALGYAGHVGCEYRPRGDTRAGLDWWQAWRDKQ
ncbi:hydroxypyruvate isomerase [Chromobacterium alkanivorans]|uniref:2-oxo-tetronate isomerase n=1 Tax=Chromobacterium alkanivorans TaxID=1071719 RepID=UPI00216957E3|nr:2-oxo-tetronate isomerase [Chromobacterium alkanivorans]MCS3805745.1 hydroxypyruvate isomerase [Chromobacterium alkanivorans]MCS3820025.1 hydroxypyruvate isomerase [Chromobacterium alkanivorans]MCS3874782.1 hydroxypyruvate isomerase [Chromobacterium alkanivorans]